MTTTHHTRDSQAKRRRACAEAAGNPLPPRRLSTITPLRLGAGAPRDPTPVRTNHGQPGSDLPEQAPAMGRRKRIALIAHDNRKPDLLDWARFNREALLQHELCATGATGGLLAREVGLDIVAFQSGPLGGDQQVGARITEGSIDFVIFFWDPLEPQPHDVDVKALLRIAVVYNIPIACNRATADFLISSPLMEREYARMLRAEHAGLAAPQGA